MRRWYRAGSAGMMVLAAALAGCSSKDPSPAPLCPTVGIINGLQSFDRPAPDGSGGQGYHAAMENVDGVCRTEGNDLIIDMRIDLVVQPGPSVQGTTLELPYFIAVSLPSGDPIDRQDFVGRVAVPVGAKSAGTVESFSQRLVGLAKGAAGYEVLFGFALPEDEALRQRQGG